jgi:hypothetical protein
MDRCIALQCMAYGLGLFYGAARHIVVDVLQYCKVCASWMPHALIGYSKVASMMGCV